MRRAGVAAVVAGAVFLAAARWAAAARPPARTAAALDLHLDWLPGPTSLSMRPAGAKTARPQPAPHRQQQPAPQQQRQQQPQASPRPQPRASSQPHSQAPARPQPRHSPRAPQPRPGDAVAAPAPHPAAHAQAGGDRDVFPGAPGSLARRVVFRFNIGFGLDGGRPSGAPLTSGQSLNEQQYYQRLQVYGFGDAVLGSRGLIAPNLNTYMAARFRFNQGPGRPSEAVPSVFDASGVHDLLIRSAYAEATKFFHNPLLKPLFLRAGRQFHYGPAIIHFDGITVGYDTRAASVTLYSGRRVSLYGLDESRFTQNDGAVTGADARVDLSALGLGPLVANAGALLFDGHRHLSGGLALRLRRAILVRASARLLDGALARENLDLRARLSKLTTVSAQLENRGGGDWAYDLVVLDPQYASGDPRQYLNIGPPLPRLSLRVRAGTVLLHAVDLLLTGTGALEHAPNGEASAFSTSYLEGSAAFEVRLRRALRIGASALARAYAQKSIQLAPNTPGLPDPLPSGTGAFGERSYYEGGVTLHYTTGVRQFSAGAELYGRLYHTQSPYFPDTNEQRDFSAGGRFSVEGWAGRHLQLRGEYDLAFVPNNLAPELSGIQSLRVMAEGTF